MRLSRDRDISAPLIPGPRPRRLVAASLSAVSEEREQGFRHPTQQLFSKVVLHFCILFLSIAIATCFHLRALRFCFAIVRDRECVSYHLRSTMIVLPRGAPPRSAATEIHRKIITVPRQLPRERDQMQPNYN